jgi:tetratricopeptide (TPR) repeat protein
MRKIDPGATAPRLKREVSQPNMLNSKQDWKRLLESWETGSASQLEHARRYTTDYPMDFAGWIAKADALWSLARYREAKAALGTAESVVPPKLRYRVWEQRGHLYREMNDRLRAEEWYRKAVEANPCTRTYILLGATLAVQGKLKEAERMHRAAVLAATPREPLDEAHLNLALVLRAKEEYVGAAEHLRKALSISPKYIAAIEVLRDVRRAHSMRLANKRLQPTKARRKPGEASRAGAPSRLKRGR